MRALESEKIRAERLACSLQDTLTNSEKEMQRVEEERKTALELVQTAHVAHFEAEQEAARRDCHYQQELAKIEAERAEDLQSYEEVRARTASSLEQRPKYTDSTVLALLKEVAEMKAEKERALQKIMKRDLQLKDVR